MHAPFLPALAPSGSCCLPSAGSLTTGILQAGAPGDYNPQFGGGGGGGGGGGFGRGAPPS